MIWGAMKQLLACVSSEELGKDIFLHPVIFIDWMYCNRLGPKIPGYLYMCVSVSLSVDYPAGFNETFQKDSLKFYLCTYICVTAY